MRKTDWPEKLAARIEAYRHEPFRWGKHDCALFAADIIQTMTGVDHARALRGAYDTEEEAKRILSDLGGLKLIATKTLGPECIIEPVYAQRGDLVLMDNEKRQVLGICIGATCACPGKDGLVFLPMSGAVAAWRVH